MWKIYAISVHDVQQWIKAKRKQLRNIIEWLKKEEVMGSGMYMAVHKFVNLIRWGASFKHHDTWWKKDEAYNSMRLLFHFLQVRIAHAMQAALLTIVNLFC